MKQTSIQESVQQEIGRLLQKKRKELTDKERVRLLQLKLYQKSKSQKKIRTKLDATLKKIGHYPPEKVVEELNPILRGWMNNFKIDKVS